MEEKELLKIIEEAKREDWTELKLSHMGIKLLPVEIGQLKNLKILNLNGNQLASVPKELGQLKDLRELRLNINRLTSVPKELGQLTNLTKLNLSSNQLMGVPKELGQLTNLRELDLHLNRLENVPNELSKLTNLMEFDLGVNGLTSVPEELGQLTNLRMLRLDNNQLTSIPKELGQLTRLTAFHLQYNQLTSIPKELGQLTNLTELNLSGNKLTGIPKELVDLEMEIQWEWTKDDPCGIFWVGNPLESPPVEIVRQGKEAVRNYFKSIEIKEKVVKLNEVRILMVGDGMAGKTSLLKQIQDLKFNKDESQTHGINVVTLPANNIRRLKSIKEIKDYQLHFWDFGGQEIMHATHQFFLSERSLYILVLDSRTDSKKHYWFKHIEKHGGDSPLIVVMNKIDENPNYNIEQKKINDSFSNIKNRFFRVSCKTQLGIQEFLTCLGETITKTLLFGTDINIDWINIKNRLVKETQANNYISRDEFIKICNENNVDDRSIQIILLKFLHDLGVVLFFEKLKLANIYILDPHWVTIGVYKIINSEKTKNGILKEQDLDYILNKEEIKKEEYDPAKKKKITYSLEEQQYIVEIMTQFELCYEYDQKKNYYIIPDLLPKELENEPELNEDTPLHFIMKYDYLPSPIISRLMIRFKNDIVKGQQWKFVIL